MPDSCIDVSGIPDTRVSERPDGSSGAGADDFTPKTCRQGLAKVDERLIGVSRDDFAAVPDDEVLRRDWTKRSAAVRSHACDLYRRRTRPDAEPSKETKHEEP